MSLASHIMTSLNKMFGDQGHVATGHDEKPIVARIAEGTPIRELCLKMISYINELEILGAKIDGESQVHMILQFLPKSISQFRLHDAMNKKVYTFSELINELCAAEGILKARDTVNMAHASTSRSQLKGKAGKQKKRTKQSSKQVATRVTKARNQARKAIPKGKYFHCSEARDWKINCPKYLATKG